MKLRLNQKMISKLLVLVLLLSGFTFFPQNRKVVAAESIDIVAEEQSSGIK